MKFVIAQKELMRLLRILRVLRDAPNKYRHDRILHVTQRDRLLRVAAQDGKITLEAEGDTAGGKARVLEEGVCFFKANQFLPLVQTYADTPRLTVEVTAKGIKIGTTQISRRLWKVTLFENPQTAPAKLLTVAQRKKAALSPPPEDFKLESE